MYPNSIYFDPKVPYRDYFEAKSIYYVGTWTLWA